MTIQTSKLFESIAVGSLKLKHRVVLAPLTRLRASAVGGIPAELSIDYYAQRTSDGGLLFSEGTVVAEEAACFPCAPGIYSPEQIEAWKKINSAVHAKGGKIVCQLFAAGRSTMPGVSSVVYAPSDIPLQGGYQKLFVMTEEDIERCVKHFAQAARNAIEAGFDGVEVHGANGYLIDQFTQLVSNKRTDSYAASTFLFPLRVTQAVVDAIGADKVGYRISPFSRFQEMREVDPLGTFIPLVEKLLEAHPDLAFIHAVEPRTEGTGSVELAKATDSLDPIRDIVKKKGKGTKFIVAGGYNAEDAKRHADETGDLVAFGRYFISNPDLPTRIEHGWPLKTYERDTFYTPGPVGYTDYPYYSPLHQEESYTSGVPQVV
ncbi:hypothetical protein I350_08051 [Cryptococcus amylolentus CBS 6273]|uniref:NADH:flavin oxidoreductase/NADH oxidase N-terminal domain-containing protein n=1 Tax=Cryptococcus amylolentus CBS 6273 TaxID=1296118 RepID=A0A1E3JAX3_9TREE|nr:hypothetical protein I350_08051 [Cryptococcus amylolentus CBS 6273]